MRSLLLLRVDDFSGVAPVRASGADAVIFDLTGSLERGGDDQRLDIACGFARAAQRDGRLPRVLALINALDAEQADRELEAIMPFAPWGIVLSGARTGADVQRLGSRLAVHEALNGLPDGSCAILPMATQTAASLFGLGTYAGCSPRLMGLAWSAPDVAAALGAKEHRRSDGGFTEPCALARALTLFGARAAGAAPIDTPFEDLRDEAGFRLDCEAARRDGFTGKIALNGAQARIINEVFAGSQAAV